MHQMTASALNDGSRGGEGLLRDNQRMVALFYFTVIQREACVMECEERRISDL